MSLSANAVKFDDRSSGIDTEALAKAETALAGLSGNFIQWTDDELVKLIAARSRIRVEGLSIQTAQNLYFRVHDLKGLGASYGFPFTAKLAASLCRLLENPATRIGAPLALIDAHLDAIRTTVQERIKHSSDPAIEAILSELSGAVHRWKESATKA